MEKAFADSDIADAPQELVSRYVSLGDRVYGILSARISSGIYSPDARLPTEHELAAQFEVSRPVVREALQRLRKDGVVYSRQGSGSYVKGKPAPAGHLEYYPVETIADIQRCYEFRLTIEPDAAYFAAQRRGPDTLERMEAALELMADAAHRHLHREDADFSFHFAVAEAANNHYYTTTMRALREHLSVATVFHGQSQSSQADNSMLAVIRERRAVFEAIRDRDADEARQAMQTHLESALYRLFEGRLLNLAMR